MISSTWSAMADLPSDPEVPSSGTSRSPLSSAGRTTSTSQVARLVTSVATVPSSRSASERSWTAPSTIRSAARSSAVAISALDGSPSTRRAAETVAPSALAVAMASSRATAGGFAAQHLSGARVAAEGGDVLRLGPAGQLGERADDDEVGVVADGEPGGPGDHRLGELGSVGADDDRAVVLHGHGDPPQCPADGM